MFVAWLILYLNKRVCSLMPLPFTPSSISHHCPYPPSFHLSAPLHGRNVSFISLTGRMSLHLVHPHLFQRQLCGFSSHKNIFTNPQRRSPWEILLVLLRNKMMPFFSGKNSQITWLSFFFIASYFECSPKVLCLSIAVSKILLYIYVHVINVFID